MENENNENAIKVKEMEHKMVKFQQDSKDAENKVFILKDHFMKSDYRRKRNKRFHIFQVKRMIAEHEWIVSERQFFGQPNTAYDFTAHDMSEVSRRLAKLQETKDKLSKNVNMRAMNMLGKAEEKVKLLH